MTAQCIQFEHNAPYNNKYFHISQLSAWHSHLAFLKERIPYDHGNYLMIFQVVNNHTCYLNKN